MTACEYPSNKGTTGYRKGCRCGRCRSAERQAEAKRRDARITRGPSHGTQRAFSDGCRCDICRSADEDRRRLRAELVQFQHGTVRGYNVARCRCEQCREAKRSASNADRDNRLRRQFNEESMGAASNRGKQWTGPELEIALRPDLTARQAAALLGRTYASVKGQRRLHRIDPRKINLAGLGSVL